MPKSRAPLHCTVTSIPTPKALRPARRKLAGHDQDGNRDGQNGKMGEGGEWGHLTRIVSGRYPSGKIHAGAWKYSCIHISTNQLDNFSAGAKECPLLDPNSIVGCRPFFFSQPRKIGRAFSAFSRPPCFALHRNHCRRRCRRAQQKRHFRPNSGRGVRLQFGLELSCLSVCHAPVARRRQPDRQSSFLAPSAGKGISG